MRLEDAGQIEQLAATMAMGMSGTYSHFVLGGDGRWSRRHVDDEGSPLPDLQSALIEVHAKRRRKARRR